MIEPEARAAISLPDPWDPLCTSQQQRSPAGPRAPPPRVEPKGNGRRGPVHHAINFPPGWFNFLGPGNLKARTAASCSRKGAASFPRLDATPMKMWELRAAPQPPKEPEGVAAFNLTAFPSPALAQRREVWRAHDELGGPRGAAWTRLQHPSGAGGTTSVHVPPSCPHRAQVLRDRGGEAGPSQSRLLASEKIVSCRANMHGRMGSACSARLLCSMPDPCALLHGWPSWWHSSAGPAVPLGQPLGCAD